MAIGFRETIVLMLLFVVPCIVIGAVILLAMRPRGQRSTAARLAELESLRGTGHISADEYDKQRASIISRV